MFSSGFKSFAYSSLKKERKNGKKICLPDGKQNFLEDVILFFHNPAVLDKVGRIWNVAILTNFSHVPIINAFMTADFHIKCLFGGIFFKKLTLTVVDLHGSTRGAS